MNGEVSFGMSAAILIVVALLCFGLYYFLGPAANKKKIEHLKNEYDRALSKGNKKEALAAGRAYYSALRNGTLTIYDEQALANDLNAM